jgi:AraC-like DNA-binding protein/GGDEF domain-containing protein
MASGFESSRVPRRHVNKGLLLPQKGRYSKTTFIRIFTASIFISLCVLLLTSFILFYSFKSIVTEEIHNQSIGLLLQTRSIFDSLHEWIIPSFRRIGSEPAISRLISSGNLDLIDISAGIDRLIEVLSSYYLVDSIYVYNHQRGEYFSTINGYEQGDCSDADLPEILNDIRRFGVYRYIPRRMTYRIHSRVYRSDFAQIDTLNVFSVVVGDIPKSDSAMNGALIVNISEQKIVESFFPTTSNPAGRLIIIDRGGIVVSHPDTTQFGADYSSVPYVRRILASAAEEGVLTDTLDGARYLISYVTHPAWGWRFINIMSYDQIFSGLTRFLIIAVIVFFALMLLSIGLAYVFSSRIYSPIHRLFQEAWDLQGKVEEPGSAGNGHRMSELQYVDRVFKQIMKNADSLSHTIERQQELYRQNLVREMLLGDLDAEALEDGGQCLGSDLTEGSFVVAVMRLDNADRFSDAYEGEELSRLFQVLKQLVSQYVPASKFVLPLGKDHMCIICNLASPDASHSQAPQDLKAALTEIQAGVARQLGITVTVAMSDPFGSSTRFQEKYDSCLSATQYRFRYGGNTTIMADRLGNTERGDYIFPEEKLRMLFEELALGRLGKVEQILDGVLAGVREHSYEDFEFMRQLISYHTTKYIEKTDGRLKDSTAGLRALLQLVRSAETLEEARDRLMETYGLITETCQKKQGSRLRELAHRIKTYIEQHFQDVSLCTGSLSELMGVSAYYVRFAYKKTFGTSLSEAVNDLRLGYCKRQLVNTKLPVKKIYKAAGFYNYSYFFTLFKKNTGLTPNQFRLQKSDRQPAVK